MKINKTLLIAALSLLAASGVMAKPQAKEETPGVAAQPASYFYTGKPYDADFGAYIFRFRNYDPELKRWTSVDPSGFPDGPNNSVYLSNPTTALDYQGLFSLTPFTVTYTTKTGGSQNAKGDYKWGFDSKNEKVTNHEIINGSVPLTSETVKEQVSIYDASGNFHHFEDKDVTYTYTLSVNDQTQTQQPSGDPEKIYCDIISMTAVINWTRTVPGLNTTNGSINATTSCLHQGSNYD